MSVKGRREGGEEEDEEEMTKVGEEEVRSPEDGEYTDCHASGSTISMERPLSWLLVPGSDAIDDIRGIRGRGVRGLPGEAASLTPHSWLAWYHE